MTASFSHGGLRIPLISVSKPPIRGQLDRSKGARAMSVEYSFEKFFADRFALFLREQYRNPTEVAAVFGVRERTAENWWNGYNSPSGAKVALAFTILPAAAAKHLTGESDDPAATGETGKVPDRRVGDVARPARHRKGIAA